MLSVTMRATSDPPGAGVFVDGVDTGQKTPASVSLATGKDYLVELRHPDCLPAGARRLLAAPGQPLAVNLTLKKGARVAVTADAPEPASRLTARARLRLREDPSAHPRQAPAGRACSGARFEEDYAELNVAGDEALEAGSSSSSLRPRCWFGRRPPAQPSRWTASRSARSRRRTSRWGSGSAIRFASRSRVSLRWCASSPRLAPTPRRSRSRSPWRVPR